VTTQLQKLVYKVLEQSNDKGGRGFRMSIPCFRWRCHQNSPFPRWEGQTCYTPSSLYRWIAH